MASLHCLFNTQLCPLVSLLGHCVRCCFWKLQCIKKKRFRKKHSSCPAAPTSVGASAAPRPVEKIHHTATFPLRSYLRPQHTQLILSELFVSPRAIYNNNKKNPSETYLSWPSAEVIMETDLKTATARMGDRKQQRSGGQLLLYKSKHLLSAELQRILFIGQNKLQAADAGGGGGGGCYCPCLKLFENSTDDWRAWTDAENQCHVAS